MSNVPSNRHAHRRFNNSHDRFIHESSFDSFQKCPSPSAMTRSHHELSTSAVTTSSNHQRQSPLVSTSPSPSTGITNSQYQRKPLIASLIQHPQLPSERSPHLSAVVSNSHLPRVSTNRPLHRLPPIPPYTNHPAPASPTHHELAPLSRIAGKVSRPFFVCEPK